MNENSPICGARVAKSAHDQIGRRRLADDDDEKDRDHRNRMICKHNRIEEHADGDEEQYRESVAQRQGLARSLRRQRRFRHHHARKESPQRTRHAKQARCAKGYAQRNRKHGQAEQFARTRMRDVMQQPRDKLSPHDQH